MDVADWNARYAGSELVWGSEPNRFVAAQLESLPAGRALDVACGEGRNAIWLATRGWHVVGVDFSAAAIERARKLAEHARVAVNTRFDVGDVVTGSLPQGPFDVVVVAYLQLSGDRRRRVLVAAAERLARGGTLVVVGHDTDNLTRGVGGPQEASVLFTAQDVVGDLTGRDGLVIEKAERVFRPVSTPQGERTAIDALVVARRPPLATDGTSTDFDG